jgi:hypothetical protein
VLLPQKPTLQHLQDFAAKIMYQYSKSHRYATTLQSILVQILVRQTQGYHVRFLHVNSHLLDHEKLTYKKHHMPIAEREQKMQQMKQQYGDMAQFLLEGNFMADIQCEASLTNDTHYKIQPYCSSLPQFILKDTQKTNYCSSFIKKFVEDILQTRRNLTMLEDHPELETTKFNPEVD